MHNLDCLLRSYFWRGQVDNIGGAKVVWSDVCLFYYEGGLSSQSWNFAAAMKLLWFILIRTWSLWVIAKQMTIFCTIRVCG